MKITYKGDYALKAILDLALHYDQELVSSHDLAKRIDAPIKFLEQVLRELKNGGFIESRRGNIGGYRLSRPPADIGRVFGAKPVAIMGASPGGFGTILSQDAWLPVLRTLGTKPWFGAKLYVSRAGSVFDAAGNMTDESAKDMLRKFLAGFAESLKP